MNILTYDIEEWAQAKAGGYKKMVKLVQSENFVNLEQADQIIDWEKSPCIVL